MMQTTTTTAATAATTTNSVKDGVKDEYKYRRARQCVVRDCTRYGVYNFINGNKSACYCCEHRQAGMVNIISHRCEAIGCYIRPKFNVAGQTKGRFCSQHKHANMIDVVSRRCVVSECQRQIVYAGLYCRIHKTNAIGTFAANGLKSASCVVHGCRNSPYYNHVGEACGKYCRKHKTPTMIHFYQKQCCLEPNCYVTPYYNFPGQIDGLYCCRHKLENMVNVLLCNRGPYFQTMDQQRALQEAENEREQEQDQEQKQCDYDDASKYENDNENEDEDEEAFTNDSNEVLTKQEKEKQKKEKQEKEKQEEQREQEPSPKRVKHDMDSEYCWVHPVQPEVLFKYFNWMLPALGEHECLY